MKDAIKEKIIEEVLKVNSPFWVFQEDVRLECPENEEGEGYNIDDEFYEVVDKEAIEKAINLTKKAEQERVEKLIDESIDIVENCDGFDGNIPKTNEELGNYIVRAFKGLKQKLKEKK